jgi:hypothetical protein
MRLLSVLVMVALASPALADADPPEPVNENVALALSLGGTALSWGLVLGAPLLQQSSDHATSTLVTVGLVGTFIAPSAGHWYADKFFTRGLAARSLGVASVVTGAVAILAECGIGEDQECDTPVLGVGLMVVGVGLYAYGTYDDIANARAQARKRNAELQSLVVAPIVTQSSTGLALSGRF